jgi:ubiquinone/menaquinone biosynthesis C-methylase UbiE
MNNAEEVIKAAFENPRWYLNKTAYNIKIRAETLVEFTRHVRPRTILDIGCGDGSLSLPLLSEDNFLTLLDRSKEMLSIAASRIPQDLMDHVRLQNADFMDAEVEGETFDLIICVGVMAYIQDRKSFVQKLWSALRPGGTLIIECTDSDHFVSVVNRSYDAVRTNLGKARFPTVIGSSAELVAILQRSGFTLTGSFRYSLPLPGMRYILSQSFCYKAIRAIYGTFMNNRAAWLGNECLFRLRRS